MNNRSNARKFNQTNHVESKKLSGVQVISAAAMSGTISFDVPFLSLPYVQLSQELGSGSDLPMTLAFHSLTLFGFSWKALKHDGTSPTGSMILHWTASER